MARLGVAPHIADKILNHQSGTISGVAAVYQRHDFLAERRQALERWGAHVSRIVAPTSSRTDGESIRMADGPRPVSQQLRAPQIAQAIDNLQDL
jgi:hypothetical protein